MKISIQISWKCPCGEFIPEPEKEHKDCLPFYVHGRKPDFVINATVDAYSDMRAHV